MNHHQQEPTLTPADVPVEIFASLAGHHRAQAETMLQVARECLERGDHVGAAARYEAAIARFQTCMDVEHRSTAMAAQLAQTHAKRAARDHAWPISRLENVTALAEDATLDMGAEWRQAHPHWGVEFDGNGEDPMYLHITPAAERSMALADRAPLILHITQGREGDRDAVRESVRISAEEWSALNDLAQRIQDRRPLPYNLNGDVRTQGDT